jgi:hypothetical protein
MQCESCGGDRFVPTQYNLGDRQAPAMACASCKVIVLDEELARTEDERSAIRRAIALRRAAVHAATSASADAETVPLMPAASPIPDESGNFKVGSAIPLDADETGIRRATRNG